MQSLLLDDKELYPFYLEQGFPHVLQRMIKLWGRPEMEAYLASLTATPRPGIKGFPQEAITEIQAIKAVHRVTFVPATPAQTDQLASRKPQMSPKAPTVPTTLTEEEHEAAMVFDRVRRW